MSNIAVINSNQLSIKEYEGKRVVTIWDIANLHHKEVKRIRNNFDRDKKHLLENEDYFLVEKDSDFVTSLRGNGEITPQALNRSKNIPIFTESGYLMMTKPMQDKLSWEVQRQLVNSYFKVKEVKEYVEKVARNESCCDLKYQQKENKGETENLETINKTIELITPILEEVGMTPQIKALTVKGLFSRAGVEMPLELKAESELLDLETIAKRVGVYSSSNKPHRQAIGAILQMLNVAQSLKELTYFEKNGHQGTSIKYKTEVIDLVSEWIEKNGKPTALEVTDKNNKIKKLCLVYKSA